MLLKTSSNALENSLLRTQQLDTRQFDIPHSLFASLMKELRQLLRAGRFPVLQREAQTSMPEHPQCEKWLQQDN